MSSVLTITKDIVFGRRVALATFLVATLLMIAFYVTEFKGTIYFVFMYFFTALGFNVYIFVKLFFSYLKEFEFRKPILYTLLMMLLNIPLGYFYTNLGFKIYNSIMAN